MTHPAMIPGPATTLEYYQAVAFVWRIFGCTRAEAFATLDDVWDVKVWPHQARISQERFAWEDIWEVACARFNYCQQAGEEQEVRMNSVLNGEYMQYPYYCDDCDSWHMLLYDQDAEGNIFEGDPEGNWEISDSDSLPSWQEAEQAWQAYYRWVADIGQDPLMQFSWPYDRSVPEKWTFKVVSSLAGPVVVSGRKSHSESIYGAELPKYVQEYLTIDPEHPVPPRMTDFKTVEELEQKILLDTIKPWPSPKVEGLYLLSCTINRRIPTRPSARQIRESAKAHLKTYPQGEMHEQ